MSDWNLQLFTGALYDFERAQYRILSSLQSVRRDFSSNRIYPHLGELITLYGTLQTIVQGSESLREALPRKIKGVDFDAGEIVYDKSELDVDQMRAVEDLIHWALPRIKDAIDEGRTIFEFVENNLYMEQVGIVPSYLQEGYLFVPDHEMQELHVLQYTLSIFTGVRERFRSLRTSHVKTIPDYVVRWSPHSLKLSLMEERRELPNPATYSFDFELDFPYEPTVLPVAKRKLMRFLFSEGAAA